MEKNLSWHKEADKLIPEARRKLKQSENQHEEIDLYQFNLLIVHRVVRLRNGANAWRVDHTMN